jgi:hypothetical protein
MQRKPATIIEKIEADLMYRLPTSGKPLSCIVLSREQAEQLLQEIYDLRVEASGDKNAGARK